MVCTSGDSRVRDYTWLVRVCLVIIIGAALLLQSCVMQEATHNKSVELAAIGWEHPAWVGCFYPHDLPPDWWLTYYANVYRAVLLPTLTWSKRKLPDVSQWYNDVPATFRFFLSVDEALVNSQCWPDVIAASLALADKLGGVVVTGEQGFAPTVREHFVSDVPLFVTASKGHPAIARSWTNNKFHCGEMGMLRYVTPPNLKVLRADIERFADNAQCDEVWLFLDSDYETLENSVTIKAFLGL